MPRKCRRFNFTNQSFINTYLFKGELFVSNFSIRNFIFDKSSKKDLALYNYRKLLGKMERNFPGDKVVINNRDYNGVDIRDRSPNKKTAFVKVSQITHGILLPLSKYGMKFNKVSGIIRRNRIVDNSLKSFLTF